MTQRSGESIVRLTGVTKRFPGVLALDAVDIQLRAGEVHALTGENGSGKSTLAKLIYGAHRPDAGTVEVDGRPVSLRGPGDALQLGIVAISQELTLAPTLSVTENILLGRMPRKPWGVDWSSARRLARAALSQLEIEVDETEIVGNLSVEMRQEVEIARAVSVESRVLVLDEPTSSLSESAAEHLLRRIEQLRRHGVAILLISHRLRELYRSASVATVLRDGKRVGVVAMRDTPERELVRMMVGRELKNLYGRRRIEHGEPLLQVSGVATTNGRLKPTSFEVKRGEILGIAGLVGSGKGELGLALGGATPSMGTVRVNGELADLSTPRGAISAGIGFVPDDRKRKALLPTRSVKDNLSAAWMDRVSRWGVAIDLRTERSMVAHAIQRFNIATPSAGAPIATLSGGNQQKVVLARWFLLGFPVLVLSEPTRGIDVGAKSDVYRHIQKMAEDGSAVVMISSELPELLGVAHRIAVMFQGELRAEFDADGTSEEEIAHVAVSGSA